MSESSDLRQRAKSAFQQAKRTVGVGDPPLATEVGGRVEAVREALRAFGDGDHDRFLSALDENVEWVGPRGENFPGGGSCDGRNAVKERFIGTVERSYAEFGFTPERYLESPDENLVVVVGAFGGAGVKGSSNFEAPSVQIWEFDGDKVIGVEIFADSHAFPEVVQEDEPQPDEQDDDSDKGGDKESGAQGDSGEKQDDKESKAQDDSGEKQDDKQSKAQGDSGEKQDDKESKGQDDSGEKHDDKESKGQGDSGDKQEDKESKADGDSGEKSDNEPRAQNDSANKDDSQATGRADSGDQAKGGEGEKHDAGSAEHESSSGSSGSDSGRERERQSS